jgi:Cu(I)/Ag(I) efflux system protein CusF
MSRALALVFALVLAGGAGAHDVNPRQRANEGVVRAVDKGAGEIVIRHGPLNGFDMPPMTMAFEVKDAALLDKVKAGDRVQFQVEILNGRFTVTEIRRAR